MPGAGTVIAPMPTRAEALTEAVAARWPELFVFAPAGSELVAWARRRHLRVVEEAFVDRRYGAAGRLLPRTHLQAVVAVPDDAAAFGGASAGGV